MALRGGVAGWSKKEKQQGYEKIFIMQCAAGLHVVHRPAGKKDNPLADRRLYHVHQTAKSVSRNRLGHALCIFLG